jgi:plastocyanin
MMMNARIYRVTAAAVLLGTAAFQLQWTPGHGAAAKQRQATVHVKTVSAKYAFAPVKLTVKAGTKVTWVNNSNAPHTVTGTGSWHFSSSTFSTNGKVSTVFKKAGTYHYICSIHPYMVASVVVKR